MTIETWWGWYWHGIINGSHFSIEETRYSCESTKYTVGVVIIIIINQVYRKIYDLVFANYTAYVQVGRYMILYIILVNTCDMITLSQELENVTALETSLLDASRTCVSARRFDNSTINRCTDRYTNDVLYDYIH